MGTVKTKFIYSEIEQALEYSSFYSDILNNYRNIFNYIITYDGEEYTLEFTIYEGRKDNSRNSEGTRYLPESDTADS